jgi:hypothetical protein
MLLRRWSTHAIGVMVYVQLATYHGLELTYLGPQHPLICNQFEQLKYLITSPVFLNQQSLSKQRLYNPIKRAH